MQNIEWQVWREARAMTRREVITKAISKQLSWAQASEITGCLLRGSAAGRSNRGHPLIPGLYGVFRTADSWIAIVGVVGRMRETFFELVGRPDLYERFP